MRKNRSIPPCSVMPELAYEDVEAAVAWLCVAFGFSERLRVGNHRAQLLFGNGAVIVTQGPTKQATAATVTHGLVVRVDEIDSHFERARAGGARIVHPPADYPYGERQYTAADPGGHFWTFSQSIADVHPRQWGGVLVEDPNDETRSP